MIPDWEFAELVSIVLAQQAGGVVTITRAEVETAATALALRVTTDDADGTMTFTVVGIEELEEAEEALRDA